MGATVSKNGGAACGRRGDRVMPAKHSTNLRCASSVTTNLNSSSSPYKRRKKSREIIDNTGAVQSSQAHGTKTNAQDFSNHPADAPSPSGPSKNRAGHSQDGVEAKLECKAAALSANGDAANAKHGHGIPYLLWEEDEAGNKRLYAISMRHEEDKRQLQTTKATSTQAHHTVKTISPQHAEKSTAQLSKEKFTGGTTYSSMAKSKTPAVAVLPLPFMVAWQAPPAQLLSSPQRCTQPQHQPMSIPAAAHPHIFGARQKSMEVAAPLPSSPSVSNVFNTTNKNASCAPKPSEQKSSIDSEISSNQHNFIQENSLSVSEERRLPNLCSILGASPGLPEIESSFLSAPTQERGSVSRCEEYAASTTPRLSVRSSITPSFGEASASDSVGLSTVTVTNGESAANRARLGGGAPTDILANPFAAASAFNLPLEQGSITLERSQQYSSFMFESVAAMNVPASSNAGAVTTARAAALPSFFSSTVDVKPVNSLEKSGTKPAVPRPQDLKSSFMVDSKRSTNEPKSQEAEEAASAAETTTAVAMKGSAGETLHTSFFKYFSPPEQSVEAAAHRSPMDSPMELYLPYVRSLRPRQWQYASILHRKFEEKLQEKKAKSSVKRNNAPQSSQRRLSDESMPIPPAAASAQPASALTKSNHLPKFAEKVPIRTAKTSESVTPRVEKWGQKGAEDVYVNKSFFNHTSSVVSPSTGSKSTSMPQNMKPHERPPLPSPAFAGPQTTKFMAGRTPPKTQEEAGNAPTSIDGPPTSFTKELVNSNEGEDDKEQEEALNRMSSLLMANASVFTDNGFPLFDTHLSNLYRESIFPNGLSVDTPNTMEGSCYHVASIFTTVDGCRVLQGVGHANEPLAHSPALESRSPPAKRISHRQFDDIKEESMIAMKTFPDCSPEHFYWWSGQLPTTPAMRHRLLWEQHRRLLREQQTPVRQLRSSEPPPPSPFHRQHQRKPSLLQELSSGTSTSPCYNDNKHGQPSPNLRTAVHTQVPPPLPMPPSRSVLARAFFTGPNPQLNVAHCGTTGYSALQPDLKCGSFVATDKSRNIDFKNALGFGLEDVPRIQSPRWDALPPPEMTQDSEM